MNAGRNRDGSIVIDELVTDGTNKWYLKQRYYGYSMRDAMRIYREHLQENGYKIATVYNY
jgi:hypothetical protein